MGLRIYHGFATREEAEAFLRGVEYANDGNLGGFDPFRSRDRRWYVKTIDRAADEEDGDPRRDDDPRGEPEG
jgi:hypothetical protein